MKITSEKIKISPHPTVLEDTRSALTPTDEVETGSVYDTGLATACQVEVESHLEEHEGRVNAVVVELEQVPEIREPLLSWAQGKATISYCKEAMHV